MPAQRRNETGPEDAVIAGILGQHETAAERLAALERSTAPELAYGLHARIDEEAEITTMASYLQAKKRSWRAELASRNAGNAPNRDSWELFQHEMGEVTPGVEANQPVWFLQSNGYAVTGTNRAELDAIGAAREHPPPDDPQQLFGMTYQRDTMYAMLSDGAISRHVGSFDAETSADATADWVNHVVRVHSEGDELRLRVDAVADGGAGNVTMRGTVLEGPVGNRGFAVGSTIELHKDQSTGAMTIHDTDSGTRDHLANGAWTATLETFAYHQGRTRVNEGVGMHLPGAGAPEKRNRGKSLAVNDELFERIRDLYNNAEAPERGYGQTLGPARTRLNVSETRWDVNVPPYRRLGGDAMFTEAAHPAPEPYNGKLPPPSTVDVSNIDWYYNLSNAMPDRFVGGRSSSSACYMTATTMLHHEGRLSFEEASDVMAFAVADMVVSGEHSLPECMTSIVMAAGSSQPWQDTPLNLSAETPPLTAWMHLVSPAIREEMATDARTALRQLVSNPTPDLKLVKGLTMLLKTTAEFERSQPAPDSGERISAAINGVNPAVSSEVPKAQSGLTGDPTQPGARQATRESTELAAAMRAGLNPTPASAQRISDGAGDQNLRHRPTGAGRDADRGTDRDR
ncbi:hypothetical protein OG394_03910 [Kribbella sp. NBC_01245]|uniref:hypothetical protein n=1 Tax=Kribbella sp. NBC_01245 TaxID=2903578 RepID=UPI002E2B9E5A|nr:hypothetical protein [Kribbella sp. NBC_01245]